MIFFLRYPNLPLPFPFKVADKFGKWLHRKKIVIWQKSRNERADLTRKISAKLHECAQYWKYCRDPSQFTHDFSCQINTYDFEFVFEESNKCPTIWWNGTSAICITLRFLWFAPMHIHYKTPFRFCNELITCFHEICYLYWSSFVWKSN